MVMGKKSRGFPNWYNFLRCSDRVDTTEIEIDCGTSVSCGSCQETCPDLSEQDPDDSFSRIFGKYRFEGNIAKGTPPESMEPCAREAGDLCPVQIIRIGES